MNYVLYGLLLLTVCLASCHQEEIILYEAPPLAEPSDYNFSSSTHYVGETQLFRLTDSVATILFESELAQIDAQYVELMYGQGVAVYAEGEDIGSALPLFAIQPVFPYADNNHYLVFAPSASGPDVTFTSDAKLQAEIADLVPDEEPTDFCLLIMQLTRVSIFSALIM